MANCCSTDGMNRFFSRRARRYAKSYRRKGVDRPTRILIEHLRKIGIQKKSILDIGCGTGGMHLTLLKDGASTAFGVDVSAGMIRNAQEVAHEMGLEGRTQYETGDFVERASEIQPADIVVLDKVICCYLEPRRLLDHAADHCLEILALSYPRDSWLPALTFGFMNRLGRLLRWSFHPYYHQPSAINEHVQRGSFREVFAGETILWKLQIFRRRSHQVPAI